MVLTLSLSHTHKPMLHYNYSRHVAMLKSVLKSAFDISLTTLKNTCTYWHHLATQWLQAQSKGGQLATLTGCYNICSLNHRSPRFSWLFHTSKQQEASRCENEVRSGFLFEPYHTNIEMTQIPHLVLGPHPNLSHRWPRHSTTLTR